MPQRVRLNDHFAFLRWSLIVSFSCGLSVVFFEACNDFIVSQYSTEYFTDHISKGVYAIRASVIVGTLNVAARLA